MKAKLFRAPDGGSYALIFASARPLYREKHFVLGILSLFLYCAGQIGIFRSFFMSIMCPTHFALAIRGLGEKTKLAASWMVTAVVGGAILPYFMGWLADHYSMRLGFIMPLPCFCFIAFYGFSWRKWFDHDMDAASDPTTETKH